MTKKANKHLRIPVTDEQHAAIQAAAAERNTTMAQFMLDCAAKEIGIDPRRRAIGERDPMTALEKLRRDPRYEVVETKDRVDNEVILVCEPDDYTEDFEVMRHTDAIVYLKGKATGYEWQYDR